MSAASIPSANFPDPSFLPDPVIHIFYDKRVADIDDDLPKYSGYWTSELMISRTILSALMRR